MIAFAVRDELTIDAYVMFIDISQDEWTKLILEGPATIDPDEFVDSYEEFLELVINPVVLGDYGLHSRGDLIPSDSDDKNGHFCCGWLSQGHRPQDYPRVMEVLKSLMEKYYGFHITNTENWTLPNNSEFREIYVYNFKVR